MADLTLEEYLKYFDVGVSDFVIAAVFNIGYTTLRMKKRSWGFMQEDSKKRKQEVYSKWKTAGYADKDICKLMGIGEAQVRVIKREAGLTKKNTPGRPKSISKRPIYY